MSSPTNDREHGSTIDLRADTDTDADLGGRLAWHRAWVDDAPARYSVGGPDDGLPVLFLHGWALGHRAYRHSLTRLIDLGCRVVAPNLPGFGGTPELPRREFTLAGYARWVDRFLDEIGQDEPVFCVGHSFGGGVATKTAHGHPGRVRSLVLVNSIGGSAWGEGAGLRAMSERPIWDWGLHFPGDIWPIPQATRVLPVILEDAVPNLIRNPRAVWRVAHLARRADLTSELDELRERKLPVTVLWGARDGVIPRSAFDSVCAAIGADGEVIDGSHSWLLADPDQFGEVITNAVDVAQAARMLERESERRPLRRGLLDRLRPSTAGN